jgi:sarcosine oxidase subunit beta
VGGLSQDLNYNVMFAARRDDAGAQRARRAGFKRHIHANRLNGVDNRVADAGRGQGLLSAAQHLAIGALPGDGRALQKRGGTARHDAVAWGYARAAADARRRYHPELRSHRHPPRSGRRCTGVDTAKGFIKAPRRSAWSPPATPRC